MTLSVAHCEMLRRQIKGIAEATRALVVPGDEQGEAKANVMLAYRHLEDASMRLGKAVQAIDGGVSVYDRTQVPTSA